MFEEKERIHQDTRKYIGMRTQMYFPGERADK